MSIQFLKQPIELSARLSSAHVDGFPEGEGWSEKVFEELLRLPFNHICVSYNQDHEIEGFLLYSVVIDDIEIITFVTSVHYRRQGVAKQLMDAFLQKMLSNYIRFVFLEVAEDNAPALALYRHYGFQQQGKRLNYYRYGRNAIVMKKIITV